MYRTQVGARWLLGSLALVLALAGQARASTIVYTCGPPNAQNLCAADGSGAGARQLTSDGAAVGGYASPSVSDDGSLLAFKTDAGVFASDADVRVRTRMTQSASAETFEVFLRPDGKRVGWVDARGMFSNGSRSYSLFEADIDGTNTNGFASLGYPVSAAWGNDGQAIITDGSYQQVCATDLSRSCRTVLASDPERQFACFELSPDGTRLAGTVGGGEAGYTIALFDTATGAPVGDLVKLQDFGCPTFSPDGAAIAYGDTGGVYRVPSAGGTPQLILPGAGSPTWGQTPSSGPMAPTAPTAGKTLRGKLTHSKAVRRGGKVTVTFRSSQALAGARVKLERRVGHGYTTIATATRSGRTLRVTARLRARSATVLRLTIRATGYRDLRRTFRIRVRG